MNNLNLQRRPDGSSLLSDTLKIRRCQCHTGALALMAQQPVCELTRSGRHEVVHVIYCQSLTEEIGRVNQRITDIVSAGLLRSGNEAGWSQGDDCHLDNSPS